MDLSFSKEELAFRDEVRGFIAYSYTHLRAHETFADLVCRLLLE
jgi:predicted metal-dependent hydrolase